MGADICNNILFIHTILGCDATSRLYGIGKGLSPKRFTSNALFRDKAEQFGKKDATVNDVVDAGEAALVCLYIWKEGCNIDGLRYAQFCDKVATNMVVNIRPLFHQPLQQRDTTACEYTCRYSSGWVSAICRAGLSLSDAQGTDRAGPLLTKAKLKAGSHPRNNKLFVLQMVQIE